MFMRVHKHDFMEEGAGKRMQAREESEKEGAGGREQQPRPEHLMADAASPKPNRSSSW